MLDTPMPGAVKIAFSREPDFFEGLRLQGRWNQVICGSQNDNLTVMGTRSIRPMYINGEPTDFGYLSSLRVSKPYRRTLALARGFDRLKQEHGDGRTKAYLLTIVKYNHETIALLSSGKAGLPTLMPLEKYHTYTVLINKFRGKRSHALDVTIKYGNEYTLTEILNFMNQIGNKRQFYPVYSLEDFEGAFSTTFSLRDFYVAERDGSIVGVIGKWDQSICKQNLICGYHGWLRPFRLIHNILHTITGFNKLPGRGKSFKMFYGSFIAVKDDGPNILAELLEHMYQDHNDGTYDIFCIGFSESDPLRHAMKNFRTLCYQSRPYLAYWDDGKEFVQQLDTNQLIYLELGTL